MERDPVRTLDLHPQTGQEVIYYVGRFGPVFKRGPMEYVKCPAGAPRGLGTVEFMFSLPKTLEDGAVLKHVKFGVVVQKTTGKTANISDLKTALALRTGN